jgi:hypothetical protein
MLDTPTLYRFAGWSSALAIAMLLVSGVALALFFSIGEPWGSINDFFIVLTALLLILPMLAIDRIAVGQAPWLRPVTIAAVAGAVLIAVGQTLLILRVIGLYDSYATGGIGLLPLLVWWVALVILAFGTHAVSLEIGWSTAAMLVTIVVFSVIAALTFGPALWVASVVLLAVISAWMGLLAMDLLRRVPA